MEGFFFLLFATLAVVSSAMVILLRSPIASAFFLIVSFVNLAGIYVLLDAHFMAVAQILVYAGAVMVLFVFVIMLLNLGFEKWTFFSRSEGRWSSGVIGFATLGALVLVVAKHPSSSVLNNVAADYGHMESVAKVMFVQYLVPFEVSSILLLVATIAAVLLAKRVV